MEHSRLVRPRLRANPSVRCDFCPLLARVSLQIRGEHVLPRRPVATRFARRALEQFEREDLPPRLAPSRSSAACVLLRALHCDSFGDYPSSVRSRVPPQSWCRRSSARGRCGDRLPIFTRETLPSSSLARGTEGIVRGSVTVYFCICVHVYVYM